MNLFKGQATNHEVAGSLAAPPCLYNDDHSRKIEGHSSGRQEIRIILAGVARGNAMFTGSFRSRTVLPLSGADVKMLPNEPR